ncbi:DUF995 domain-containing protein [Brucella tritici]|uniref:DUF995 domain-containing protein n=1 Tax=Brucella tritici TaxID=94626 RepID=UPI00158FF778|nr:DUF995 domain-containing protein [Brucella tritici]
MSSGLFTCLRALVVALGAATVVHSADLVEKPGDAPVSETRPLTVKDLHALYENRTWLWNDGAGYFGEGNRLRFTAFSGRGAKASYADGRWYAQDPGRICFTARWFASDGNGMATTCFEHKSNGQTIWQRRLPSGQWYVFGHIPPRPGDEVLKLKQGDLVAAGYERNKLKLSQ